jgi:hypothetical protein
MAWLTNYDDNNSSQTERKAEGSGLGSQKADKNTGK